MNSFFLETESPFDLDTTVEYIFDAVDSKKWKVININDIKQTLENHGQEVLPVKVLSIFCSILSGKLLSNDQVRIASSFIPYRLSVYQKENGKVYISRFNLLKYVIKVDVEVRDIMLTLAEDVEDVIRLAIN